MHAVHRGKLTAPYISCRLRIAEIRAILEDPEALPRLLEIFKQFSTNPDIFAKKCGISNHVLWQEAEGRKFEVRMKWGVLASILYIFHGPSIAIYKDKGNSPRTSKKKSEKAAAGVSRNAEASVDIKESEVVSGEYGTACNGASFAKQPDSGKLI